MKLAALFLSLMAFFVVPQDATKSDSQPKPEELAQKSAEAWLAISDAGKYPETWDEAAAFFRSALTKDQWVSAMNSVRAPLGKVESRKLKSARFTTTIPRAPEGQYVIIQYDTNFENRPNSVETITPMLDKDGKWRVSGYYIK
jgi:hypothetical protein